MSAMPNVLLVDDRPDNLLVLEAQLRELGAEFLKARSGREALDLLLTHPVAVAIIDVQMPEMDGFELAELMRGSPRTRSIPIILVTAGLHDHSRVFEGYEAGAVDFLIKPIEPRVLVNKLRVFLQLDDQHRALSQRVLELDVAQAALRESEARYRRLFENMAEGFFLAEVIHDEAGEPFDCRFLEVNAAYERQTGLDRTQVVGRTVRQLFPRLDGAWIERFAAVATTGLPDRIDAFPGTSGCTYSTIIYSPCPGQLACVFQDISDRKKAEEALRTSEELLRTVVENSRDAINMLDLATGRYVFMSPAQVALTGFTAEEMRDLPVEEAYERVHPEDRQISARQQQEIAAGRDVPGPVEYRWKVKSGEYRWFSDTRSLVRDPEGRPAALVGVSRDITDRKQVEAELRRAKDLSEALNRIGEVVHTSLDIDEVVRRVVQEGARALGSESAAFTERVSGGWRIACVSGIPEELLGTLLSDEDELHAVLALETQRPVAIDDASTDARVNREHLRRHGVRSVLAVPLIHSGRPLGVMFFNYHTVVHAFEPAEVDFARQLGVTASIALQNARLFTEREQTEQALRARETRLALLSRTAGALLRAEDPQRVIDQFCQEVIEHLDCQAFFNFLVDGDAGRLRLNACAGISATETARIQWMEIGAPLCGCVCVARDGQRFVAEDILRSEDPRAAQLRSYGLQAHCCFPLAGQAGQILGTLSFGTRTRPRFREDELELMRTVADQVATAIQRLEARKTLSVKNAQLVEADRRKNEFLAVLSHELRNPLAPIKNSLYILDRSAPGGDQARRAKAVLDRQVNQLARLIDDLLDVTRVTRNKVVLQRATLELNDLVRRAAEDQRSLLEGNGLALELQLAPRKLFVHGDGARLAQVVSNLLQNAAKFTHRGGSVRVVVEPGEDAGEARVRVRDDGIGMAAETLARLFEPFMQAEASLDRSKGGLGLGLALVKGLVELHGGEVSARSDGLGHGSEFVFWLPLAATECVEQSAAAEAPRCAPQRVLVIEDNVDAADSLCEALTLGDHRVEVAYNGPEGLAKARAFRPAVVLCDIGLPGMDGYEVARAFRADEELRAVFLVALSGYALPEDLRKAREAGFARHLAKPPSLQALESLLAEVTAAQSLTENAGGPTSLVT